MVSPRARRALKTRVGLCSCASHFSVGGGGAELSAWRGKWSAVEAGGGLFPRRRFCVVALAAEALRDGRAGSAPPPPADVWDVREHIPTGLDGAAWVARLSKVEHGADSTLETRATFDRGSVGLRVIEDIAFMVALAEIGFSRCCGVGSRLSGLARGCPVGCRCCRNHCLRFRRNHLPPRFLLRMEYSLAG